MAQPIRLNLSSEVDDIADQLCKLEKAGPDEIALLAPQIRALSESELISFANNVLVFTKDESLLSLVYDSPAVICKLGYSTVTKLYSDLYDLYQTSMISPDVYQRLAASLISYYPNHRSLNLLKELQPIVARPANGKSLPQHNPGPDFDHALSWHLQEAPYRGTEELFKSWDSLKAVELPKTLEVFLQQMLADSQMEQVGNLVIEFFQQDKLPETYIDVFRRILGDDVFFGLCVKANATGDICLSSTAKIVPLAGEQAFHSPEFLAALKTQISGPYQSSYLKAFSSADCDENTFPILASFVMDNLQLVLKDSLTLIRLGSTLPVVRLAHRQGLNDEVLQCVIESSRVKIRRELDRANEMSLTELVNHMTWGSFDPLPDTQLAAMCERLKDVIEVVGLETAKKVIPDVDHRFIQSFAESGRTHLSKAQVMRMFPQIKGPTLEDELGL
jgi:hypothetical protein